MAEEDCSDFIVIPAVFYVIVAAAHLDLPTLRRDGWLFDVAVSSEPWYHFYSYFGKICNLLGKKSCANARLRVAAQTSHKRIGAQYGPRCRLN